MSFRLSHHAMGEGLQLPSSGAGVSLSQNFQSSQELMPPPSLPPSLSRARTQPQSFMYNIQQTQRQYQPRMVDSFASRIRNLQLQPNNQTGYGGGDPRVLRQQR